MLKELKARVVGLRKLLEYSSDPSHITDAQCEHFASFFRGRVVTIRSFYQELIFFVYHSGCPFLYVRTGLVSSRYLSEFFKPCLRRYPDHWLLVFDEEAGLVKIGRSNGTWSGRLYCLYTEVAQVEFIDVRSIVGVTDPADDEDHFLASR